MTNGVFNDKPADPAPETPGTEDPRLAAKDAFIEQLQLEAREAREALAQRESVESMLAEARRIAANPPPSPEAPPAAGEPAKPLDEAALVERVIKAQEDRQAQARADANASSVVSRLVELYGSEEAAAKVVEARATELKVGKEFLLSTAKQSPEAFYDLMKLQTAPTQSIAPRSDVNTGALSHASGVKEGTEAYYEKLRAELGAAFYTPKIQNQRMKDRQRLGEDFYK